MLDIQAELKVCEAATEGPWTYFGEALMGSLTLPDGRCVSGVEEEWCEVLYFASRARTGYPVALQKLAAILALAEKHNHCNTGAHELASKIIDIITKGNQP